MKKVLLLLVTVAMLLSSTGCSLFKKNQLDNVIDNTAPQTEVITDNTNTSVTDDTSKEDEKVQEIVSNPTNNTTNNVVYTETPGTSNTSNESNSGTTNPSTGGGTTPSVPSKPKDTTAPVIEGGDIVTEFRTEPNFDTIYAIDETDGRLVCSIIGNYDITKAGIYPMSAVAIDRAGNSATKYFNLIVNEHPRQGELNEAEKDVLAKKNLLDEAIKALEKAREELIRRNGVLNKNEEALLGLNNKLADLTDKKDTAESNLTSAKESLTNAEELLALAKDEYDANAGALEKDITNFRKLLNSLNTAKDEILDRLSDAEGVLKTKTDEYNNAVAKLDTTKENLETEKANLDTFEDNYAMAGLRRDLAQARYEETLADVARKQQAYDEAVYRATESEEFKQAQEDLKNATEFLATAKSIQTDAVNTLADATISLNEAVQAQAAACTLAENAKCALDDAIEARDAAQAVVDAAEKELDSAKNNSKEAQEKYDEAVALLEASEARKEAAEKQLEIANKAYEKADENLANANAAVDNALARYEAAQAVIASGSLGFFASRDDENAQLAVDVITQRIATQDNDELGNTNLGQKGDATSLENMAKVFDLIREGNDLRENDEYFYANDLLVNDVMMAIAQIQTNAAAIPDIQHSGLTAVPENLAWGYSAVTGENGPYQGWYHEEKLVWEVMNNEGENADGKTHTYAEAVQILKDKGYSITCCGVGHYENLVSPGYAVTGLAYNSVSQVLEGGYPNAIGQTFINDYTNRAVTITILGERYAGSLVTSNTYTVDEYEEMFKAYVEAINKELADAQQALADARSELSQLQATGGITAEELQAVVDAQTELDAAKGAVFIYTNDKEEAANELAEHQAIIDEKQKALDEANEVLTEKLDAYGKAKQANDEAQDELGIATAEVDLTNAEVEQAEAALAKANKDVEDAEKDVIEKQNKLNELDEAVDAANTELKNAEGERDIAKDELDDAIADEADEKKTLDEQQKVVDDLTTQQKVDEAVVDSKKKEVDKANDDIEAIEADLDINKEDIERTENGLQKAQDTLTALIEEVEKAENEVNTFTQTVNELEEEVGELTKSQEEATKEIKATEALIIDNKTDVDEQEVVVDKKEEEANIAKDNYDAAVEIRDNLDKEINGGND